MRFVSVLVLLVALGLCTGAAFADPANDTGETWDHIWPQRATWAEVEPNNTCATAQPVALGDIVDPASIVTGDVDFYKIYLTTADRLTVLLDRATGCTLSMDTLVDIYRDDCATILFTDDDDGPGLYSYIMGSEWTPPYTGDYYIKVRPYSASTGCYKVWFYAGLNATGACCSTAGVCTLVAPGSCYTPSIFQGPATVCTPNPCVVAPTGACCNPTTGACTLTVQASCYSPNIWHGEWTVCSPNPCPQPALGACCVPATGACTMVLPASCLSPSIFHAEWLTCTPNPCPQPQPPPVNDTCAGALPLDRCSGGVIAGDLTWALNDYSPAGTGSCTGYSSGAPGRDVVYLLNVQAGDLVHLVFDSPAFDAVMYVVTDCANVFGSCVVGGDEPEPVTINWTVLTTGTYYLMLDAYTSGTGGPFTLTWSITCPPTGACCNFATGDCAITLQAACTFTWLGAGVPCDASTCPVPPPPEGACCDHATGNCTITTQLACQFDWLGAGVPCNAETCPPPPPPEGACCNHATGECTLTIQTACPFDWLGAGVPCNLETCPVPPEFGACCDVATGDCTLTTQAACQFHWLGAGVPCNVETCPIPPPPMGSCCYSDGTCAVTTQLDCTALWTLGGVCVPNTCEQPPPPSGSCCYLDGTCAVTTQAGCTATWLLGGVCVPNTCEQPPELGACCDHATGNCAITTEAACQFSWLGAGVPCDLSTCQPPVPVERTSWGQIKNTYR